MKPRLKTSWETYNRIIWDAKLNERVFVVGYIDRVAKSGVGEKPVIEWSTSDIPWNRVQYFSCGDTIVWDRQKRIDLLESDELPAIAFNNKATSQGKTKTPQEGFSAKPVFGFNNDKWAFHNIPNQNLAIPKLKIATYNILSDEYKQNFVSAAERFQVIAKHLAECNADIIVLQETTRNFLNFLYELDWMRQLYVSDIPSNSHFYTHRTLIISKYAFELAAYDYSDRKQFLVASWTFNDRPFHLCGVHLSSNMANNAPLIRARQLAILTKHLQSLSGDFAIAGDFNMREGENLAFLEEKHLEDAWTKLHPDELGYTFDTTKNKLAEHFSLSKIPSRYDRILLHSTKDTHWKVEKVDLFACQPMNGDSIYASDHFGLWTTVKYEKPSINSANTRTDVAIQPTYKSAIVIIPPKSAWRSIQPLREKYDNKVARWMPHITLIYGFWPEEYFELAVEKIAHTLKIINPFSVELKEYAYFSHRLSTTAWLRPMANELKSLQKLLQEQFPNCDEQSTRGMGFTPHLGVGQFDSVIEAKELLPNWKPMDFEVGSIALISRTGDEPFRVQCEIKLGSGKVDYLDTNRASRYAIRKMLRTLAPSISQAQKELQEFALDCVRQACEEVVGFQVELHLLGSAKLGTASTTSDLDALCLIPVGLTKLVFFEAVKERLKGISRSSTLAMDAHVPVLRIDIEGISIDLLCVQQVDFPAAAHTITENDASRFDETSWQAFSGHLEVERITNLVAPFVTLKDFQDLVKAIRAWAKVRLIKGNAWGFLGNYSWTVLAAWSCLQLPLQEKRDLEDLLFHFFKSLSKHDWSKPIALTMDGESCKIRPKQDRMPIITSVKPYFNSARNVTASTAQVIQGEIDRGLVITKKIEKGKEQWATLFEEAKQPDSTKGLLKIELLAENERHLHQICGWLEGNIVGLVISLEKHLEAFVRPWTGFQIDGLRATSVLSISIGENYAAQLNGVLEEFSHRFDAENAGEIRFI